VATAVVSEAEEVVLVVDEELQEVVDVAVEHLAVADAAEDLAQRVVRRSSSSHTDTPVSSSPAERKTCWSPRT